VMVRKLGGDCFRDVSGKIKPGYRETRKRKRMQPSKEGKTFRGEKSQKETKDLAMKDER